MSNGKTHVITYSEALCSPPQLKSNPLPSQTVQQSQFNSGANTDQPLVHHQGSHRVAPSKISTLPLSQLPLSQISQDASQSQFILQPQMPGYTYTYSSGCFVQTLVPDQPLSQDIFGAQSSQHSVIKQ